MDNKYLDKVVKSARNKRIKRRVLSLLSAIVLLTTTNRLVLLADTLERTPTCGLEEHEHISDCYGDDDTIICGLVEHVHTDACRQERPKHDEDEVPVGTIDSEVDQVSEELPAFVIGEEGTKDEVEENSSGNNSSDETSPYDLVYDLKGESYTPLKEIVEKVGLDFAHVEGYGESDLDPVKCLNIKDSNGEVMVYITHDFGENDTVELVVFTDDGEAYAIALKNGEKYVGEGAEEEAEEEQPEEQQLDQVKNTDGQPEGTTEEQQTEQPMKQQPEGDVENQPKEQAEASEEQSEDEVAAEGQQETDEDKQEETEGQPKDTAEGQQDENAEGQPEEGQLADTADDEQEDSKAAEEQPEGAEGQPEEDGEVTDDEQEGAEEQPEEAGDQQDETPDDQPVDTSSAHTYEATIDLSALKAPYSLKALMSEVEKSDEELQQGDVDTEDTEESQHQIVEAEDAVEDAEPVKELPDYDLVDNSSIENWIIEYDSTILLVEFDKDDYYITPGENFTNAAITVHAGDTYVLNLLGQGKAAEGPATITAADGGVLPESATAKVDVVTNEDEIESLRNLIKGQPTLLVKGQMGMKKSPSKNLNSFVAMDVQGEDDATEAITSETKYKVFDISLENAEGYEGAFHVDVELDEAVTGRDFHLYHIHDKGSTEIDLDQTEGTIYTLSFDTPNFSQFVFEYTVDFHYQVDGEPYSFSIPGGGYIALSDLVERAQVAKDGKAFVEEVDTVWFSDESLISVSKAEQNTTVGAIKDRLGLECAYSADLNEEDVAAIDATVVEAGDWALISLKAFTSEESLTIQMKDGEKIVVKVTDAAGDSDSESSNNIVTIYLGFYNGDAKGGISNPANILSLSDKYYINGIKNGDYAEISVEDGKKLTLQSFACGSTYTFIGWVDIDKNNKIVSLDESGFGAVITNDMNGDHILAVHIHATRVNAFVNSEIMGKVYKGNDDITNVFAHLTTSDSVTAHANDDYLFVLWKAKTDKMTEPSTLDSDSMSVRFTDFSGVTAGENSYITAYFKPVESNQFKINYKTAIINGSTKTVYDSLSCDAGSITTHEKPIIDLSTGTMQDPDTLEFIDSFNVDASVSNDDYVFVGWYTRGAGNADFPIDNATRNSSNSLNSGKVYKSSYLNAGYSGCDLIAVYAKKNISVTYKFENESGNSLYGLVKNGGSYTAEEKDGDKNYYSSLTETLTFNVSNLAYEGKGASATRNDDYMKGFMGWFDKDGNEIYKNMSFVPSGMYKDGDVFVAKTNANKSTRYMYRIIGSGATISAPSGTKTDYTYAGDDYNVITIALDDGYVIDHWSFSYNDYSNKSTVDTTITGFTAKTLSRDEIKPILISMGLSPYYDGLNTFTVYTRFIAPTIKYVSSDTDIGSVTVSSEQLPEKNASLNGSKAIEDHPENGHFDGWYLGEELLCSDETYVPTESDINKFLAYCTDNNTDEVTITAKFSDAEVITINYAATEHGSVDNTQDQYAGSGRAKGSTATPNEEYEFFGWYFSDGNLALNTEKISASDLIGWKETEKIKDGDTLTAKFGKGYDIIYQKQMNDEEPEGTGSEHIAANSPEGKTADVISGYNFLGWYKGDEPVTANSTLSANDIGTVTSDMTFTAKYATAFVATYEVEHVNAVKEDVSSYGQVVVGSEATSSSATQTANTERVLTSGATAIPARGCEFAGWEVTENEEPLTTEQVQAKYGFDTSAVSIPAGIKIENNVSFKAKFQKQSGAMEIIYTIQQEATDRNYGAQITVNGVSKSGTATETAYLSEVVPEGQNALGCVAVGLTDFPSGADSHIWNYNIKGWAEGDNAFVDDKDGEDYASKDHLLTLSNVFVPTGEYLEDKNNTGVRYFRVVPKREANIYLLRQVSIAEGGFWAHATNDSHMDNILSYLNNTATTVPMETIEGNSNQSIFYPHLYIEAGYTLEGFTVNGVQVNLINRIEATNSRKNYDINSEAFAIDEAQYGYPTLIDYIRHKTSIYYGNDVNKTISEPAINILIARFIAPGYNIEYHVKNGVGGTVSNNGDAYSADEKTAGEKTDGTALIKGSTAIADSGNDYVFVRWEDADEETVSTASQFTPKVDNIERTNPYVYHYYAVFEKRDKLTVLYEPDDPTHGVTSPGSETVYQGVSANGSLATAYEGYIFSHWTREGSKDIISKNPNFVPNVYGVSDEDKDHVTQDDFAAKEPVKFIAHFRTEIDSKITVSKVVNVSEGLLKEDVDTVIYIGLTRNGVKVTDKDGKEIIKEIVIEDGKPQNTAVFEGLPYNDLSDTNDKYEVWEMHKVGSVYERQYIGMLIGEDYQLTAISTSNNSAVTSRKENGTFTEGSGNNAILTESHKEATVTLKNTYSKETDVVSFEVIKEWQDSDGQPLTGKDIPSDAKVEMTVYSENGNVRRAVKSIWLDGAVDANGEQTAWKATFNNLPKFASDGTTELTYKVRETGTWEGYKPYINSGSTYLSENIYLYNNGGKIINKADKENTVLITVQKVDKQDNSKLLAGATFNLTQKNASGVYESFNDGLHADGMYTVGGAGDGLGLFSVALPDGVYQIQEKTCPTGYVIVTGAFNFRIKDGELSGTPGDYISFDSESKMITIKNEMGVALPSTGGPGTTLYTVSGIGLITLAAFLFLRKWKSL